MTHFGFSDLHGFKDYVGWVKLCAPDSFPSPEVSGVNQQWTLDLAFEGLRSGLKMAVEEKGPKPIFATCEKLVEEAYTHYREGRTREGFFKLQEAQKLLKKIPTQ
jgi:hypothetical protein